MKISENIEARFWCKVEKGSPNQCWLWTAALHSQGYGWFGIQGKPQGAHRISWIIHYGEIPQGLFVCHHCDNKPCVNPHHLFLGTASDNQVDSIQKGRGNRLKGSKHWHSKVTEKQVLSIRELYATGDYTQKELGKIYGIGRGTVSKITTGATWSHLC